jgi:hypothetical protein
MPGLMGLGGGNSVVSTLAIRQSLVFSAAILTDCLCFQVVAAATTLTLPHGASIVHISGTTHVTSVEADPGHMLRPMWRNLK